MLYFYGNIMVVINVTVVTDVCVRYFLFKVFKKVSSLY
jgi:hypothetical protein